MAVRIFHKDHGYVITSDRDQINTLLAKGGVLDTAQTKDKEPDLVERNVKPQPYKRKGK